jgi:hypothetical protein
MRRAAAIAATVAGSLVLSLSLTACDDLGAALDPDPVESGATPTTPAPAPPPRNGRVLLGIDGDARTNLVFGQLTEPVTYAGGDGPLSLVWRTATYDLFTLGGEIRLGAQPTSSALRLQLAVDLGRGGVIAFASDDGSCTVTVARAARRSLAGDVTCTGLTDAEGRLTIDVTGTFEAGGGDG